MHNVGQLIVAANVVKTYSVIYYAPVLIIAGVFTGIIIGIVFFLVPILVKLIINISGITETITDGDNIIKTIACILK